MATIYAPQPMFNISSFAMERRASAQRFPPADSFDMPSPSPGEDASIHDLSAALSAHTLRPRRSFPPSPQAAHPVHEPEPPVDDAPIFTIPNYDAPSSLSSPVDSAYASSRSNSIVSSTSLQVPTSPASTSRTYSTADVRRHRQRALKSQCSAEHLREISALVARMVSQGEQCNVCDSHASGSSDACVSSECGPHMDEDDAMTLDGDDSQPSRPGTSGHDSGRDRPSMHRSRTAMPDSRRGSTTGVRKQAPRRRRTKA